MNLMLNQKDYFILTERNIIIEYYSGEFRVDEFLEFKKTIAKDPNYDPNFNVFHDFRNAEFIFNMNDISKYIAHLTENKEYLIHRKSSMLTNSPNQVVTSLMFEMLKKNLPIKTRVCSTLDYALDFIGLLSEDRGIVESWIEKRSLSLKKQSE